MALAGLKIEKAKLEKKTANWAIQVRLITRMCLTDSGESFSYLGYTCIEL